MLKKCRISNTAIEKLQKSDFCNFNTESLEYFYDKIIIDELPVAIDELRLAKRRPDLEPYIKASVNGSLDRGYVRAYQLAKILLEN